MSLKTQKQMFLSNANTKFLVKSVYQAHLEDGGKNTVDVFWEQVPNLMSKWKALEKLDIVSVNNDSLLELKVLDRKFVQEHKHVWQSAETKILPKTWEWTAEDYGTLDLPVMEDKEVTQDMYRWDNAPLLRRTKLHSRHLDLDNEGMSVGRSLEGLQGGYVMDEVYNAVNTSHPSVNHLVQFLWGDSSTELLSTSF